MGTADFPHSCLSCTTRNQTRLYKDKLRGRYIPPSPRCHVMTSSTPSKFGGRYVTSLDINPVIREYATRLSPTWLITRMNPTSWLLSCSLRAAAVFRCPRHLAVGGSRLVILVSLLSLPFLQSRYYIPPSPVYLLLIDLKWCVISEVRSLKTLKKTWQPLLFTLFDMTISDNAQRNRSKVPILEFTQLANPGMSGCLRQMKPRLSWLI